LRVEEFGERSLQLSGWDIHLTTYRLGAVWHCKADNVSPGAALARTTGYSRDEAESRAIERAEQLLVRMRRNVVIGLS
jgi:hypothetical protein